MYRFIREFHLWLSLALAVLLLMYAGTGVLMLHGTGLPDGKTRREHAGELPATLVAPRAADAAQAEAFVREVGHALELRGRGGPLRIAEDGSWSAQYRRPGTRETVTGHAGEQAVRIDVVRNGPVTTLDEIHEQRGYWGGPLYFAWALIVDLTSIGLVLFALSGVLLWWTLKRDWLGGVLLFGSVVGTVAGVVWQVVRV